LFDEGLCFFVVISVLKDDVRDNKSDRAGDALNAVDKNVFLVFVCILYKFDNSIEEALNVLVLRVLEEKGKIFDSLIFKPVFAIISSAVDYVLDLMLIQRIIIFCHLFPRDIQPLNNLTAFLLAFLTLSSSLF
jgi:hypothetical protein